MPGGFYMIKDVVVYGVINDYKNRSQPSFIDLETAKSNMKYIPGCIGVMSMDRTFYYVTDGKWADMAPYPGIITYLKDSKRSIEIIRGYFNQVSKNPGIQKLINEGKIRKFNGLFAVSGATVIGTTCVESQFRDMESGVRWLLSNKKAAAIESHLPAYISKCEPVARIDVDPRNPTVSYFVENPKNEKLLLTWIK